jgi:hypothetical protein
VHAFERFHEVVASHLGIAKGPLNLLKAEDVEAVLKEAEEFEARVDVPLHIVVFDTVRAAMPYGDENSPRDMGTFASHIGRIRERFSKAHILLVHHTPKGRPTEAIGHTALSAMLDLLIVVGREGKKPSWKVCEANDLGHLPQSHEFTIRSIDLGLDASGYPLDAPVVISDATAPSDSPVPEYHLSKDTRVVLDALKALQGGEVSVSLEEWREAACTGLQKHKPRHPVALRKAFSEARRKLTALDYVAVGEDRVSVSSREQGVRKSNPHSPGENFA